jgi:hypothetical protein
MATLALTICTDLKVALAARHHCERVEICQSAMPHWKKELHPTLEKGLLGERS